MLILSLTQILQHLERTTDNSIDAGSKVLDVAGVEASHGDTAVLGHVDVGLLGECLSLLRV